MYGILYSMPNVTTYIRKDDIEKWLACPNKAFLIHNALNNIGTIELEEPLKKTTYSETIKNTKPIIKTPKDAVEAVKPFQDKTVKAMNTQSTCKHGKYPGLCKVQGCRNYQ